jgi:hypothetical protein
MNWNKGKLIIKYFKMEKKLIFKVYSTKETRGKQRIPALLLKNPQEKLSELWLAY